MKYLLTSAALISLSIAVSGATVIDFESQASHGPSFDESVDSPLVIGIATFTGGEVLGPESGSIDETNVYATTGGLSGGYTNPIVITFSAPISGFSVLLTNNDPDTFTVADNVGDTQSLTIGPLANQTFNLSGVGITQVTIGEAVATNWDFAIDNVTFTAGASAPEPGTLMLLGAGLAALGYRKRHQIFKVR